MRAISGCALGVGRDPCLACRRSRMWLPIVGDRVGEVVDVAVPGANTGYSLVVGARRPDLASADVDNTIDGRQMTAGLRLALA